jgi:nucleotide-binding universal stress UspA family protein
MVGTSLARESGDAREGIGRLVERNTYLVPVDGSARADIALLHAMSAAKSTNGLVVILGVTWVPPTLPLDDERSLLEERTRAAVQNARSLAWQYACPVQVQHACTRDVSAAIVRTAREIDACGIFLQPRHGIPRWLMVICARSTWRVLRRAPCPVYLGPAPTQPSEIGLQRAS